jgi:hypothetical protein
MYLCAPAYPHLADSELGPRAARVTRALPCWTVTCAPWTLKKIGDATGTEPTPEQAHQVIRNDAEGAAAILLKAANAPGTKSRPRWIPPRVRWRRPDLVRRPTARLLARSSRRGSGRCSGCSIMCSASCASSNDPTVRFTVRPGCSSIAPAGYWMASWGQSD